MVMFNSISEAEARRGCFLEKELFFLQGFMRNNLAVNEMGNCAYGSLGSGVISQLENVVVVMESLVRVTLLGGIPTPGKSFLPLVALSS